MDQVHVMARAGGSDDESVYACEVEGCGRRVVVNWRRPEFIVLDRGDFFARHVSGGDNVALQIAVQG
jgi:hypothetical protein